MKYKGMLALGLLAALTTTGQASNKTICGMTDDRIPSTNPKVGRIQQPTARAGCTVTMIGKVCAVSAGHCYSTFGVAEFNTPPSRDGRIQHPEPKDIYQVDLSSVVYENGGYGNDYAVLRLKANTETGALPGELQGTYPVDFSKPSAGTEVRITGYGADSRDADRNFAQQTHTGPIQRISGQTMYHRADTMGGNSGSSIINEESGGIVAIHTHGGCSSRGGANASTLISGHSKLEAAIRACLKWEEDNL